MRISSVLWRPDCREPGRGPWSQRDAAIILMDDLWSGLVNRVQLTNDCHEACLEDIDQAHLGMSDIFAGNL
jgi:hypothetical protein